MRSEKCGIWSVWSVKREVYSAKVRSVKCGAESVKCEV